MTLEEIVRAFASEEPVIRDEDGDEACMYCHGYGRSHIEDCPWLAAKLFDDPRTTIKPAPVEPFQEDGLNWVTIDI